MQRYAIELFWNAAPGRNPWERTSALVYVTCKPKALASIAENTREYYGADSVEY